jgi:hypothetical protein
VADDPSKTRALTNPVELKKSMSKQKKDREAGRHPTPDPSKQQQAEELFVFRPADSALKFESPQDLARYLRENKEDHQFVLQSVKQKLDTGELRVRYSQRGRPAKKLRRLPSSGSELADCFDPPPGSEFWIEPAGRRRRLRKLRQLARQREICLQIQEARVKEGKLYLAVERVAQETGLSKSTIYRAWKTNKR